MTSKIIHTNKKHHLLHNPFDESGWRSSVRFLRARHKVSSAGSQPPASMMHGYIWTFQASLDTRTYSSAAHLLPVNDCFPPCNSYFFCVSILWFPQVLSVNHGLLNWRLPRSRKIFWSPFNCDHMSHKIISTRSFTTRRRSF